MKQLNRYQQHPPLRTPNDWKGQAASLVIQIERLFDDVYTQISQLKEKNKELEARISELEEE